MSELLDAILDWKSLLAVCLVFGFLPRAVLRIVVLALPDKDERRELINGLHYVPRWDRPIWVFEQLERAVFEGIGERLGRGWLFLTIRRWRYEVETSAALVAAVDVLRGSPPSQRVLRALQPEVRSRVFALARGQRAAGESDHRVFHIDDPDNGRFVLKLPGRASFFWRREQGRWQGLVAFAVVDGSQVCVEQAWVAEERLVGHSDG